MSTEGVDFVLKGGDFKGFANRCIRSMMVAYHQIDQSMDVPYKPRQPSEVHPKALEEAKRKLAELEALTREERLARASLEYEEEKAAILKAIEDKRAARTALEAVLEKAKKFVPPTPEHEGFKTSMINQLLKGIETNGNTSNDERDLAALKRPTTNAHGDAWYEKTRKALVAMVEYHAEEARKDVEHCELSNAWVAKAIEAINATGNPTA